MEPLSIQKPLKSAKRKTQQEIEQREKTTAPQGHEVSTELSMLRDAAPICLNNVLFW